MHSISTTRDEIGFVFSNSINRRDRGERREELGCLGFRVSCLGFSAGGGGLALFFIFTFCLFTFALATRNWLCFFNSFLATEGTETTEKGSLVSDLRPLPGKLVLCYKIRHTIYDILCTRQKIGFVFSNRLSPQSRDRARAATSTFNTPVFLVFSNWLTAATPDSLLS